MTKNLIIGITGLIGSGKDTAADHLCTMHGFKRMSFASTLKDAISVIFSWDRELLEGSTKASREWREQIDVWWSERLHIPNLTPRYILQIWGTEVCRRGFHKEIWVASIENKIRNLNQDIVITDCRFKNEVDAIRKLNGIVLRTHRGIDPEWLHYAELYNASEIQSQKNIGLEFLKKYNVHASEYSSVGLDYDYHLNNNDTIDSLHTQLDKILLISQPAGPRVSS